jgi:hypothetical protein
VLHQVLTVITQSTESYYNLFSKYDRNRNHSHTCEHTELLFHNVAYSKHKVPSEIFEPVYLTSEALFFHSLNTSILHLFNAHLPVWQITKKTKINIHEHWLIYSYFTQKLYFWNIMTIFFWWFHKILILLNWYANHVAVFSHC